jgi:hypothetical protein
MCPFNDRDDGSGPFGADDSGTSNRRIINAPLLKTAWSRDGGKSQAQTSHTRCSIETAARVRPGQRRRCRGRRAGCFAIAQTERVGATHPSARSGADKSVQRGAGSFTHAGELIVVDVLGQRPPADVGVQPLVKLEACLPVVVFDGDIGE